MDHHPASWIAEVTSFDPPPRIEAPADWDAAVRLLAHHGLASLAGYNLQYRILRTEVPETAKDVLLGYHQGTSNDNVFKLITLKKMLDAVGTAPAILIEAAAFADALYPHVAFRPVPELRLIVREEDVPGIVAAMGEERFVPGAPEEDDPDRPHTVLWNQQYFVKLYTRVLPKGGEAGLFERAVRARAYGPSAQRLSAEDALLVHALSLARRGFVAPLVELVDVREMVRGAPGARSGPGAPLDPELLRRLARETGADRALWAALKLTAWFFPAVAGQAETLLPELGVATRTLLEGAVVGPARELERERGLRGLDKVVRLLVG